MPTTKSQTPTAPAVSVIVPCYNLGLYLDEAIESVLAQSFQDFEIVVVDDGSTEPETQHLLESYTKPKTRVVRTENHGLPAAKNRGLKETTGAYVCMFDADDRLDPAYLESSKTALDDDPNLAFVSHWFRTFGDEEWEWTPTRCDLEALLDANTVNGAALVRRTALDSVGGFDETMRDGCEDWDIWITLVERGFQGRILEDVLFYYRRRPDSMSRVMMEGDCHPRLFKRLVEKHADSYRQHMPALLTRRERDASHLAKHLHALELDFYREVAPELARRQDDIVMLEARREREERACAIERATARSQELEATVARQAKTLEGRTAALDRATARARALDATARKFLADLTAVRSSWSWRLTSPFRALADLVGRFPWGGK